jgi:hypothetical protein
VVEDEYRSRPSTEDDSDSNEVGFRKSFGGSGDGSLRMEYNNLELRQFKGIHVKVPSVPNFMDTGLTLFANVVPESQEMEITEGMVFHTLEHL